MKSKLFAGILSACVSLLLISGPSVKAEMVKSHSCVEKKGVTIEYFGHASFGISDSEGMKVVTDPYDPTIGFNFPSISTQILTVSHDHFDHNYVSALKSYKQLIFASTGTYKNGGIKIEGIPSTYKNGGIKIEGIPSWHDDAQGTLRGPNTIYTYEINNIKVCHLGDLGHQLSKDQIKKIGKVDVLMIPVGGFFTINSDEAVKVINSINPKIVIPMHYVTDASREMFGDYLSPVEDFTSKAGLQGWKIEKVDKLTLTRQMLNNIKSKKVFVLNYN